MLVTVFLLEQHLVMLSFMLGENKRALQCGLVSVLFFFTWIIPWEKYIFSLKL